MGLTVTSIDELDQATFDANLQLVKSMLQAAYPTADFKRGAVHDLVLVLSSAMAAVNQDNIDRIRRSNSLREITADPTLADADTVARLMSNYRITPSSGTSATGTVAIVLTSLVTVTIPLGQTFTDGAGRTYKTLSAFTGRTSSVNVVATTDRLISAVGNGTFVFTVSVTDTAVGTAGNLPRLAALTATPTISGLSSTYVATDFTGGTDAETNAQLLARQQSSWTSRSLANRTGVDGLIRAQTGFANILASSVTGFGDAEQRRNHSILPVTLPGRIDVWVRTQALWQSVKLTKTATLISTAGGQGKWQFTITRDDAPGFYEIEKILLPANDNNTALAGYTINQETRGYDISVGTTDSTIFLPDITAATEAAYSRYETSTVQFTDTDTSISGLTVNVSTKAYSVFVRVLPGVTALQDALSNSNNRSLAGDALVRAPVPCFVTAAVTITQSSGTAALVTGPLKQAAADAINNIGFTGKAAVAVATAAIQALLPAGNTITTSTLAGRVHRADNTDINLSATSTTLDVCTDAANLVTANTVGFFCRASDVTITVA